MGLADCMYIFRHLHVYIYIHMYSCISIHISTYTLCIYMYIYKTVKVKQTLGHDFKRKQEGSTWEGLEGEKGKRNMIVFEF